MHSRVSVSLMVALAAPIAFAACKMEADARHDTAAASRPPTINPVQNEMRRTSTDLACRLTGIRVRGAARFS